MPKRPVQTPGPPYSLVQNRPHGNRVYRVNEMQVGEKRFFPWNASTRAKDAHKNWRACGRARDLYGMRFAKEEFEDGILIVRIE